MSWNAEELRAHGRALRQAEARAEAARKAASQLESDQVGQRIAREWQECRDATMAVVGLLIAEDVPSHPVGSIPRPSTPNHAEPATKPPLRAWPISTEVVDSGSGFYDHYTWYLLSDGRLLRAAGESLSRTARPSRTLSVSIVPSSHEAAQLARSPVLREGVARLLAED